VKQPPKLLFEPGWPRIRQLAAKKLRCTEEEIQRMADRGDSLDQVELGIAVEDIQRRLMVVRQAGSY
jgi:hypothetical protein